MRKTIWKCIVKKMRLRIKCNLFVLTCYKQTRDGHLCYAIGISKDKGKLFALMQEDLKCYGDDMVLALAAESEQGIMDLHYHVLEPGHEVYLEYRIDQTPFFRAGGVSGAYEQARRLIEQERAQFSFHHCDWCGSVAQQRTWRTLYAGTEGEHTSNYWECDRCTSMSTADLLKAFSEPLPF